MYKTLLILVLLAILPSIYAISIITNYSTWQSYNPTELNFNTIANQTYLTTQFVNQGVLFGSYSGSVYVSDVRIGTDVPGYKQIDFGVNEWLDITFVIPGSTTASYTTGFGIKLNTPDNYNWVSFYDISGNLLATYIGTNGISAAGNYFLGAYHAEGIGRVRVGSSNTALESYNYEVIAPNFPEPGTFGLLLVASGILLAFKSKVKKS